MALTLNTTVGTAAANAFCTLAEATAYHEGRLFNDEWASATTAQKNAAIVWATSLLNLESYIGIATFRVHGALRWPRYGVIDREGLVVDPQTVPDFIKAATAEYALNLLREERTKDQGALVQYGGKIGPITDPTFFERKVMPESVREILRPYLALTSIGASGIVRRG